MTPRRPTRRPNIVAGIPRASAVTITHRDGTVETQPAMGPRQASAAIRRLPAKRKRL